MERLSVISTQNHCSFHLWQRESIKYCDEVILQFYNIETMTQIAMKFVQWDVPELEN